MTQSAERPPEILSNVGVVGGGRMGSGVAHAFLISGIIVTLVEASETAASSAKERVLTALHESAARGAINNVAAISSNLNVTCDFASLKNSELIIEAVPEDITMKLEILAKIEESMAVNAVLATNTSSLSVTEMAAPRKAPDRFLGLHFFNPVPTSTLVEIIHTSFTQPEILELASNWVKAIKKTSLIVRDSPGFASSRLGLALGLEAMRMVEEEVASPSDIDAAMTLGYRHPIGPLRLTDLVGLDVRLNIAEYLAKTLGPRFAPPPILINKVKKGELGRKTGQGFYSWEEKN